MGSIVAMGRRIPGVEQAPRRAPRLRLAGPDLDDLAYQAAADALIAITSKLGQFRGESRFTTWAYKFVIFEVSAKIGRHFWRHPGVPLDAGDWDRLPARFGFDPAQEAEWRDLLAALRRAVEEELTARQRRSSSRWARALSGRLRQAAPHMDRANRPGGRRPHQDDRTHPCAGC